MAETGNIRYDSFLAALALALAPTAVIRARLFQTKAGQLLNLEKIYDGLLKRINDRLMIESYVENKLPVNLLAYNNSVDGMKSYLLDIYKESYSTERRALLITDLENEISNQPTYIEKRKYCAKLLLQTVRSWDQLKRDNLAPCTQEDLESDEPPADPEVFIREKAHCAAKSNIARELIVLRDRKGAQGAGGRIVGRTWRRR